MPDVLTLRKQYAATPLVDDRVNHRLVAEVSFNTRFGEIATSGVIIQEYIIVPYWLVVGRLAVKVRYTDGTKTAAWVVDVNLRFGCAVLRTLWVPPTDKFFYWSVPHEGETAFVLHFERRLKTPVIVDKIVRKRSIEPEAVYRSTLSKMGGVVVAEDGRFCALQFGLDHRGNSLTIPAHEVAKYIEKCNRRLRMLNKKK